MVSGAYRKTHTNRNGGGIPMKGEGVRVNTMIGGKSFTPVFSHIDSLNGLDLLVRCLDKVKKHILPNDRLMVISYGKKM